LTADVFLVLYSCVFGCPPTRPLSGGRGEEGKGRGLRIKSRHLLISSPRWGEDKGEWDFMDSTITPTLFRQRERGTYYF